MLSNEVFVNNDKGLQMFCQLNINILNKHAPRKNKNKKKKICSRQSDAISYEKTFQRNYD